MQNLKELIQAEHLIVIVRGVKSEQLVPLAEAMYEGGVRLLEITYSANGKVSDEETAEKTAPAVDFSRNNWHNAIWRFIRRIITTSNGESI